jgi:hypothetical protein
MPDDTIPSAPPSTRPILPPAPPGWLIWNAYWPWAHIKTLRLLLIVFFVLVMAYILAVVWPFSRPSVLTSDDVGQQWNDSISRLGINAVYPLQEDFRVGDIWATIYEGPEKPILGNSVRIGHIDLESNIPGDMNRPIFADTTELDAGKTVRVIDRLERSVADEDRKKISTAIAAFPTFTINHTAKSIAASLLAVVGVGGSRAGQQYEQIDLLDVETVGVQAKDSYARFLEWCRKPESEGFCIDDTWARRLLAAAVTP